MEEKETPHNPNYYLVINEFKATTRRKLFFRLVSDDDKTSCYDVELTFSVYIFHGGEREHFYARAEYLRDRGKCSVATH